MDDAPQTRLPLRIGELVIRRILPDDHRDIYAYWPAPETAKYQFWGAASADQVTAMIDGQAEVGVGDPGVPLILVVALEETVIGDCSLTITSVEDGQAEIGYVFNPRYAGRGLATQAVTAVLGFGFLQLGLHRVIAAMDTQNERSWRLAERIGMRREAHFRHDNFVRDEWMDSFGYAMLDDEWRDRYPALVASVGTAS